MYRYYSLIVVMSLFCFSCQLELEKDQVVHIVPKEYTRGGAKKAPTEQKEKDAQPQEQSIPKEEQPDEMAIYAAFDAYHMAIANKDGTAASGYVSLQTLNYYGRLLEHAKTSVADKVKALPVLEKMLVLLVRHTYSKDELAVMTGRDLFIAFQVEGVVNGWEMPIPYNASLGEVQIANDRAEGEAILEGLPSGGTFLFYKEDGGWKWDLLPIFASANAHFTGMLKNTGMDENQAIVENLQEMIEATFDENIWNPVF